MSVVEPDSNWPEDEDGGATGGKADTGGTRWGRLGGIAAAAAMSMVFAVAAWYALQRPDLDPAATVEVPLVKAESGVVKEKPKDPGGLKIPNQDKLVYERVTPKAQAPLAEKLAPAPEEPIIKPKAGTEAEDVAATASATVSATASAPAAPVIAAPKEDVTDNKKATSDDVMTAKAPAQKPAQKQLAAPNAKAPEKMAVATEDKAKSDGKNEKPGAKTESLLPAAKAEPQAEPKAAPIVKSASKPASKPAPKQGETTEAKPVKAKAVKPEPTVVTQPAAKTAAAKASTVKSAKPKTKVFRIQMAAYRSTERARAAWSKLRKAHGAILGSLSPHTQRVSLGTRGVYFRVQAGPFPTARAARAACAKLQAKRQDCIIVTPK